MKINKQFLELGFKQIVDKSLDYDGSITFINKYFGCKINLCKDGSWGVIALAFDRDRYIMTNYEIEIIQKAMKELAHDEEFWEGIKHEQTV